MSSKKLLYNLNLTDNLITLGNLNSDNITTTNISTSSLTISGNVSFNSITIPNAVFTNVSSGSITATSSTISNSVFANISTSSLLAVGNTNTLGSIITTGGNIGINTINPTSRLDVNGTINANTYTGANISISGILNSNTISSNVISASTITGGNLYLSNNVFIGGSLTTVNITTTNLVDVTISSGSIYANNITSTNIVGSALSTGTLNVTTSIASVAINATNITSTNIVSTTISTGTIVGTTLISSANVSASVITAGTLVSTTRVSSANLNSSSITTGIIYLNSASGTNIAISPQNGAFATIEAFTTGNTAKLPVLLTPYGGNVGVNMNSTPQASLDVSGTFRATTSVTSGALYASNVTATNIVGTALSTGTLNATTSIASAAINGTNSTITNAVHTALSTGTLNATTSIASAAISATNVTATNAVHTAVSTGTLNAITSIASAAINASNITSTNIVGTTISAGTIVGTTLISSANVSASVVTAGTLVATTITGANIYASNNLFVGGTLTTVNITSTNLVDTNISAGVVLASTLLSAPGNSNTLGSIFTTGGNVGIGSANPTTRLQVNGGISAITSSTITNQGIHLQWNRSGAEGESWLINQKGGGTANSGIRFGRADGTNNVTELMRILDSGNVGIATTSPGTTLDVSGTFRATTSVTSGGLFATNVTATNIVGTTISAGTIVATTLVSSANMTVSLITTGTLNAATRVSSANLNSSSITTGIIYLNSASGTNIAISPQSGAFCTIEAFTTGNTAKLPVCINPYGGFVGIGTNNPGSVFEVSSTAISNGIRHTNSGCSIETFNNGNSAWLQTLTNHPLNFAVNNGSSNLTLNTNGNVGIGTETPNAGVKLQVLGKVGIGGSLDVTDSSRGVLNVNASAVDFHSTKLMSDYAQTISHITNTNGSLGIAFGISSSAVMTPGASIIHERTGTNSLGLLHFLTKSGAASTSANLIRMTVQTSGNVGIGTTSPTSTLQINGSLAKTSGTFDIKHPIVPDKRLVHSFIEGPRCDLIYRGKVTLQNGQATVNLDTDCVQEQGSAMTQGTFEALCANPDYYLQNNSSFDRVKGSISGNILTIICENSASTDKISWMIVAERKDEGIKEWARTNSSGYLITEYSS